MKVSVVRFPDPSTLKAYNVRTCLHIISLKHHFCIRYLSKVLWFVLGFELAHKKTCFGSLKFIGVNLEIGVILAR